MKLRLFLCALAALVFAGCVSARVSQGKNNVVTVENEGFYLFACIPICTGDPEYPNQEVASWWENTLKVETNIRLLDEAAANQGARGIRNIVSHQSDETILYFLFKRKMYRTSAELIKD